MEIRQYQSLQQRKILTGMIVHDEILAKIFQRVGSEKKPFGQRWLDIVAQWCFVHFAKYGQAPRRAIQSIFSKYAQTSKDEETVEIVEKFLDGLSSDYTSLRKELNEDYIIDLASDYFRKVKLLRMAGQVEAAVEKGDLDEAEVHQSAYQRIDFSYATEEDPFSKEAIKETFRKVTESETLIDFPGDLGVFLSPYFRREGFIAFAGPEKRGKSYWLLEVVWQALRQKRKVLYYVFGDMPKYEVYQRLYCRALRRPWRDKNLKIPYGLTPDKKERTASMEVRKETREGFGPKDVWRARKRLLAVNASNQVNLKVKTDGGYVLSASDIENRVKDLANKEGWVPDVVVIDYADILKPEPDTRNQEVRHQMNMMWAVLRRIGLQSHCLVVTGTQTAATAYADKWVIKKGDFSEDKRKNAHATGILGINQTDEEKERGIYRLNWVVLRGGKWSENRVIWCAGNLSIACPCIVSSL